MCVSKDEQRAVNELECETEAKKTAEDFTPFPINKEGLPGGEYFITEGNKQVLNKPDVLKIKEVFKE